jgi:hypothetical protein
MSNSTTCYTTISGFARCQMLIALLLKMQVFQDVIPYQLANSYWYFDDTTKSLKISVSIHQWKSCNISDDQTMQVRLCVMVNTITLLSLSLTSLPTLSIILPLCSWPVSSPDLWSSRSRALVEINKSHSSQASRYSWDVLCKDKETLTQLAQWPFATGNHEV